MILLPPRSKRIYTIFPYTTLFLSHLSSNRSGAHAGRRQQGLSWRQLHRQDLPGPDPMNPTPHWAADLIGRPWRAGARGPHALDCWGLFLAIQREHFGRDLPEIPINANDLRTVMNTFRDHPERQRWAVVAQPTEGDEDRKSTRMNSSH